MQKLILYQKHEILNVFFFLMRSTLLRDKALEWAKAKVHVYSDSVLCLGKMNGFSESKEKWKDQLQYNFQDSKEYRELFGIDAEPVEFEWHISQETLHCRMTVC